MISGGLNEAFGTSLRRVISRSTSNKLKAFSVGTFVAAIIQSSTAAIMIVSSFSARNVITVAAAMAVVLGAGVGTTLAAQVLSLDMQWLIPVLVVVAFVANKYLKKSRYRPVSNSVMGVALVLLALDIITSAAEPLRTSEAIAVLISPLVEQPIMAVLLSAILTWIAHSSLGMVLLYMGFVSAGTIPVELGIYLVVGANIGSAVPPVLLTMKALPAGRRVPLGNLMIRVVGGLLVLPIAVEHVLPAIQLVEPHLHRALVDFHTIFNLALAFVFLPFVGPLTKLSEVVLPDRSRELDPSLPKYLDPDAVQKPAAALAGAMRETLRTCDIVQNMFDDTLKAMLENNSELVEKTHKKEKVLDKLYSAIKFYLSRLNVEELSDKEADSYMLTLIFATNLEHVGDIIDRSLLSAVKKKIRNQASFSKEGRKEIEKIHAEVSGNIQLAHNIFMSKDVDMAQELASSKSFLREEEMKGLESHLRRLGDGVADTIATSSVHLDILRDFRRINSYIAQVAYPIINDSKEYRKKRDDEL